MDIKELQRRAGITEAVDYKRWREVPAEQAFKLLAEYAGRAPKTEVGSGFVQFYVGNQPFMIIESLGGNEVVALVNPEIE